MPELVLYGIRLVVPATPGNSPRYRGGEPLLAGLERRRYKKGNKHRGGDYDYCLLDLGTGIQKRSSSFSGGMGGPSQRPWKTVTYNKK